MKYPITGGHVSADFNQMRPLNGPKTHKHGAIDVAGGDRIFRSPVDGEMQAFVFLQQNPEVSWDEKDKPEILTAIARNYWYHIYGGVILIKGEDRRTHLFMHFWVNQLTEVFKMEVTESRIQNRYAPVMLRSAKVPVTRGQIICNIGSAGISTGPHLHWEVHPDGHLVPYQVRINPEAYIE